MDKSVIKLPASGFLLCIGILMMLAVAMYAIPTPTANVSHISFKKPLSSDAILEDKDVQIILKSSLFEGVETSISHSTSKHPDARELRNKCLSGEGTPVMMMENPDTMHCVEVIQDNSGRFLVRVVKQIDGIFQELTAFTDEWSSIDAVERYLNGVGYMHIWSL